MNGIESTSKYIKDARNKSFRILAVAVIWLIVVETFVSIFSLGDSIVVVAVLPVVIFWAYYANRWFSALCPICSKPMFIKSFVLNSIFKCTHCGYDLVDSKSSSTTE